MIVAINEKRFDLSKGKSIAIGIKNGNQNPNAFYAPLPNFEAVRTDTFVGDTQDGGLCNFKNVMINPHGNGTHTECVGHIAREIYYIKDCLQESHFIAQLVTIEPEKIGEDNVITKRQIENINFAEDTKAIIIRTLPNNDDKKTKTWSGNNPPYIHHEAMQVILDKGIEHFLIDLPSVDREEDEGKLLAHKTFWNYPSKAIRKHCTITEMVYVSNEIKDGEYLINIQVAPIELDANSSDVVIYEIL